MTKTSEQGAVMRPDAAQIDALNRSVTWAWASEPPAAESDIRRELTDVDTYKLIETVLTHSIAELCTDPGELCHTSILVYGGPKTKKYFLQVYLRYVLAVAGEGGPDSSVYCDMCVNALVCYCFDDGRLECDSFYSVEQCRCIEDVIRLLARYPFLFGTWGCDAEASIARWQMNRLRANGTK